MGQRLTSFLSAVNWTCGKSHLLVLIPFINLTFPLMIKGFGFELFLLSLVLTIFYFSFVKEEHPLGILVFIVLLIGIMTLVSYALDIFLLEFRLLPIKYPLTYYAKGFIIYFIISYGLFLLFSFIKYGLDELKKEQF